TAGRGHDAPPYSPRGRSDQPESGPQRIGEVRTAPGTRPNVDASNEAQAQAGRGTGTDVALRPPLLRSPEGPTRPIVFISGNRCDAGTREARAPWSPGFSDAPV